MFKKYLPIEYLCIDIANAFGNDSNTGFRGDKELFETRIQWVKDNINVLEDRANEAEEKYLYIKAVMALRDIQKGKPTGHLIMLDAACSGLQIMSALTGCLKGGDITCLVDPNKRSDAYKEITDEMNGLLASSLMSNIVIQRKDAKSAVMTAFYGSKAEPLKIFGDELIDFFYNACDIKAPGPSQLLDMLIAAWNKGALFHQWTLPDGFVAHIKVMEKVDKHIEVDELGGYTFDTSYKINMGKDFAVSLAANVIHSIDAYLLRSIIRRCNYRPSAVKKAIAIIKEHLDSKHAETNIVKRAATIKVQSNDYQAMYENTGMIDITTMYALTSENVKELTTEHLVKLLDLGLKLLNHKPFPVLTVHDAFRIHPNNGNELRYWYKECLAELAESRLLDHVLSTLYRKPFKYLKHSNKLPNLIRNSNYAIS